MRPGDPIGLDIDTSMRWVCSGVAIVVLCSKRVAHPSASTRLLSWDMSFVIYPVTPRRFAQSPYRQGWAVPPVGYQAALDEAATMLSVFNPAGIPR
jgi:hypothetical protein